MLPVVGDIIGGKYRIVRLLGEGGMGVVYEARHLHLDSSVALKFLQPELAQRQALVARFLQEARVSASIKSPHVIQVVDVDQTPEGAAYLVMELLEGEALEARLGRDRPLPSGEAVDIGVQILAGLEAAHARGVIHRDLKPDNVWLSPSRIGPYVKLLDFGIAKLKSSSEYRQVNTRPGSMMGTPAYMAPEQAISADQVDQRADLYSFGVILYEMLSGTRPVDGDEPSEVLERLMRGDIHPLATRNPKLLPGLTALVDRLVTPDPDSRPSNAGVVRAELMNYASTPEPDPPGRPSAVPPTVPPDDQSAPPFVTATHAAIAAARVRTDAMPERVDLASARTEPTAGSVRPPSPAPKRGRTWPIVGVCFALVIVGAGVWVYSNQSIFDLDTPPMPEALPAPVSPPLETASPAIVPIAPIESPPPLPVAPRANVTPRSVPASTPAATGTATPTAFPSFPQFPPIAIPSVLPIPSGLIPSSLPPFFSQFPGFNPNPGPAPAAPPTVAPPPTVPPIVKPPAVAPPRPAR